MSASHYFKRTLKISAALICFVIASLFTLIDEVPLNPIVWQADVHLARELFKKTAESAQQNQDLRFNQLELNHAVNSILNRYLKSLTKITFAADDSAQFEVSLQLPKHFSNYYVNIRFVLHNQDKGLSVHQLYISKLPINQRLADFLINFTLKQSVLKHYYMLAREHIQAIQIQNEQLIIHYQINTLATHFSTNVESIDAASLSFYQQKIEQIVSQHNPSQRLSLTELLQPLFKAAYQRSPDDTTALNENLAVIFAVSAYVNSNEIPFYLPLKVLPPSQFQYPVYLNKRNDQAKHFMLSAALTSTGGAQLADILGQEKELRDAQSSSGFSFIDLAADRAGMKFTEQAIKSPREFQLAMANIKDYSSFMPSIQNLPEKLTHTQFTQQYDSINSKAYKALLQEIDNRIEALPIFPAKQ